jgi:hypothetical protein
MTSRTPSSAAYQHFSEIKEVPADGAAPASASASARKFRCLLHSEKPGMTEEMCGAEVTFHNVGHLNQHLHNAHKSIAAAMDDKTTGRKRVNPIAAMFAAAAATMEVDDGSVVGCTPPYVLLLLRSSVSTLLPCLCHPAVLRAQ